MSKIMPENIFDANNYPLKEGNYLLEASAGTGKTFSLAHLVLRLLTEKEYDISEILVVTFTEASASEIKARIGSRLIQALNRVESYQAGLECLTEDKVLDQWIKDKANNKEKRYKFASLILEALEGIDRADITTIHGFCSRTLKSEAIESGVPISPQLEVDDYEPIIELIHEYWSNQVLELNPEDLKGIEDTGLSIEKLRETLFKIDTDPSVQFKQNNLFIDDNLRLSDQFEQWMNKYWMLFLSNWRKDGKLLTYDLEKIAEHWRSQGFKDTKPFSPSPTKDRYDLINKWVNNIDFKSSSEGKDARPFYSYIREQKLLGNYFHPGIIDQVARRVGEINFSLSRERLQKSIAEVWDGPAELVWDHALLWLSRNLLERRERKGSLNYNGLLKALDPGPGPGEKHATKKIPISPNLLITKVRRRYRAALIDEFQDTDPIQWRFLKQAFGESKDHLLIMVGDPKQAIYQFRGGDLNTYLKAKKQVDRIDSLVNNYRANPSLMDSLNRLMANGLRRSNLEIYALNPNTKGSSRSFLHSGKPLQILTLEESLEQTNKGSNSLLSKSSLEKKVPIAVANVVLEMLQTNTNNISPADICVLVSRHDQASSIRIGLAMAGVPSRLVSRGDIFTSEAAQVLQRFLNCLSNPADSESLRLVACSVLMQWNKDKLNASELNGELDQLAVKFKYWSKNLSKLGLLGCISELLEGETFADLSERGRLLGDLNQCAQLVQETIHTKGLDAKGASKWLKRKRLSPRLPTPDEQQPNSDVAENAVNVVTVHRSKGLQYQIVICPYLWQAPPVPKGPLWKVKDNPNWFISLNTKWGAGRNAAEEMKKTSLEEAERLAYVALTRAQSKLIILWGKSTNQEGNPLTSFLFGPNAIDAPIETLSLERMREWLSTVSNKIEIISAETNKINNRWKHPKPKGKLSLGPIPKRKLDTAWGRSSYSSWINNYHYDYSISFNQEELEIGRDIDQESSINLANEELLYFSANIKRKERKQIWSKIGPLSNFPRGASAGDCLHRILERVDFKEPLESLISAKIIEEELNRSGIDNSLTSSIQDGLKRVFNISLGGPLGDFKLKDLNQENRVHELSFDLPISNNGKAITAYDLSKVFKEDPMSRFGSSYASEICNLNIESRGFLTGSIDLVFIQNKNTSNPRWWVADWKSNWLGEQDKERDIASCGPIHYDDNAMENQMKVHHYPLQAHLYLVALHRFLLWRLPNYKPEKNLGGYIYIFLRGIPSEDELKNNPNSTNCPGLITESAPINRILMLDQLLHQGGG